MKGAESRSQGSHQERREKGRGGKSKKEAGKGWRIIKKALFTPLGSESFSEKHMRRFPSQSEMVSSKELVPRHQQIGQQSQGFSHEEISVPQNIRSSPPFRADTIRDVGYSDHYLTSPHQLHHCHGFFEAVHSGYQRHDPPRDFSQYRQSRDLDFPYQDPSHYCHFSRGNCRQGPQTYHGRSLDRF